MMALLGSDSSLNSTEPHPPFLLPDFRNLQLFILKASRILSSMKSVSPSNTSRGDLQSVDLTFGAASLLPSFIDVVNNATNFGEFNYDDDYDLHNCDPMNEAFNCTIEDYLVFRRGPQTLPFNTALLATIFFLGIFITGIVGNVLVCIVIIRHPSMHTATNYYLFSLAVSDVMLIMTGIPNEVAIYWHQYPFSLGIAFCKIRALIQEACSYVSVLTIVAFSMERFLAICYPLHLYTMSGFKRALKIIAVLWIISFLSASPFAVFTKIDYLEYPVDNSTIPDSAFCAMLENPPGVPLCEISSCIFFIVPMIFMLVLYIRMGCRIHTRTKQSVALGIRRASINKETKHQQSKKAIIRMLAAVVIAFFISWAPFHVQRVAYLHAREWEYFQELNSFLFMVGGWFYYVSGTLNPILYNVMSNKYRSAFKETLCGKRREYYYQNNGFSRQQSSSVRETTISTPGCSENKPNWV